MTNETMNIILLHLLTVLETIATDSIVSKFLILTSLDLKVNSFEEFKGLTKEGFKA